MRSVNFQRQNISRIVCYSSRGSFKLCTSQFIISLKWCIVCYPM